MEHIYSFNEYISKINEGLIHTYDINKTTNDISELISSYDIEYDIIKSDTKFKIELGNINTIPNFDSILKIILDKLFNTYGWFPSKVKVFGIFGNHREYNFNIKHIIHNIKDKKSVIITFESKFDEITEDIPEKLYHLSIGQYTKDILQKGLICKEKSKLTYHGFGGGIYLCKSIDDCKKLIAQMKFFYNEEKYDIINNPNNPKGRYNKNTKWIIYEIDTKIGNIRKLYRDPNYLNGFYYVDNINRKSISIVENEV